MDDLIKNTQEPRSPAHYQTNVKLSKAFNFQRYIDDVSESDKTVFDITQSFGELQYNVHKPYILCYPKLQKPVCDPYFTLLYDKSYYNRRIEVLRSSYRKNLKSRKFDIDKLDFYKQMQELLNTDPDEYFNSNYNWYYSGGNLDIVNIGSKMLIYHAANGSDLCVASVLRRRSDWLTEEKKTLQEGGDNIFEIKTLLQNNKVIVGVRQKKCIEFYKTSLNNSLDFSKYKLVKTAQSELPFISFSLNPHNIKQLVTLNLQQEVCVFDVNKDKNKTFKISKIINTVGENWGQINYLDSNMLIHANNVCYNIADLRTSKIVETVLATEILSFKNKFTNLCVNHKNNYFYLSSNHNTLQIDARMHKIVNKWTHLLKNPVMLSDTFTIDSNNLICLASRYPNEKLILSHQENIINMPVLIPTLSDSLDVSLAMDAKINMTHSIRKRCTFSTTGIKFSKNGDDVSLLSVNSVGDISVNEININNDSTENLKRNTQNFNKFGVELSNVSEPLNFIDKVVIKDLHSVLNSEICDSEDYLMKERQTSIKKVKNKLKKKTANCKTLLTSAWELEFPIQNIEEIDSNTNVQLWLSRLSEGIEEHNITDHTSDPHSNLSSKDNLQNRSVTIEDKNKKKNGRITEEQDQNISMNINSQQSLFSNI